MYQQASAAGEQAPGADAGAGQPGGDQPGAAPDDDVVDADFEEVKDNK